MLAGFDVAAPLLDPFQRSVYMMFLVAETQPFVDGNGRLARIAMNAEPVANAQVRIIVPTLRSASRCACLRPALHDSDQLHDDFHR